MNKFIWIIVGILFSPLMFADVALVYRGPGACEDGCVQSAALVAEKAGFQVQFVGPTEIDPTLFIGAKVWLQPGGQSSQASRAMREELKENLKNFVAEGGGYVGFCAGGFIATEWIANRGIKGFGFLHDTRNELYPEQEEAVQLHVQWKSSVGTNMRHLYWEGGPYFTLGPSGLVEPMAWYSNGMIAAVRTTFKKGKVFVVGPHPEAPEYWRQYFGIEDLDGMDFDLANEMVQWVTWRE